MKFLILFLLIIIVSACQPNIPLQAPTAAATEALAATQTAASPAPTAPAEAPTFDAEAITTKDLTAELKGEYPAYFADPFGLGVVDGSYDAATKTEWLKERDTLNAQIDAGWENRLSTDTAWKDKLASWGLPVPDITQWESLSSADKLQMVKAYWKANNIMEGNLPTSWIVDAHNNPANYPVQVIKNHWPISGFSALINEKFQQKPSMELTNGYDQSYDYNRHAEYSMYGEKVRIPWASTYGSFITSGDGIVGLVHITGVPRQQALELWMDVPDRRPVDQFQTITFQPMSRKGSVCLVSNSTGSNVESACSADQLTSGLLSLGDGGAIVDMGGAQTTDNPDVLLSLLAKCSAGSCQISTFNPNIFINGQSVISQIDFNKAPPQQ